MKLWHDRQRWDEYCSPEGCPVCNKRFVQSQPDRGVLIAELRVSRLSAFVSNPTKGYCCLTAIPHAIELFDLEEEDALNFMRDVRIAAQALKQVSGAIKINYDIHGNTIPHLHMHLFPRLVTDKLDSDRIAADGPIEVYAAGEFEHFIDRMKGALQELSK